MRWPTYDGLRAAKAGAEASRAARPTYALTPERGDQVRADIESMVRNAGEQLRRSRR